jgi:diguanylate cyclase (GGDEF)-like protein
VGLRVTVITCRRCGGSSPAPACPFCLAELALEPEEERRARTERERAQTRGERDQTSSDTDQTSSDEDQTSSDTDQASSDSDQRSSDEDQEAADDDLAAGSDQATHDRTSQARKQTERDRVAASLARDQVAAARLHTASARDRAAKARDLGADDRDTAARLQDLLIDPSSDPDGILVRGAHDREEAASDRARAADDRVKAATDREIASRERTEALEIRARSEEFVEQAATDQLTGARTRDVGLEESARELQRARRTHAQLMVAFVDVDGLKRLNDSRGHPAGDAALRLVGQALRANLRPYDVIVRYGGDEFLCAMPNLSAPEARARFKRIAHALAAGDSQHSISFGLAQARDSETFEQLIARADADLIGTRGREPHD